MRSSEGWLLVRQSGGLWGLKRGTLRQLRRCRAGAESSPEIDLDNGETVSADELLGLVDRLEARACPAGARPFLPSQVDGLAVWRHEPVALLRPGARLPACFVRSEPERSEPERSEPERSEPERSEPVETTDGEQER